MVLRPQFNALKCQLELTTLSSQNTQTPGVLSFVRLGTVLSLPCLLVLVLPPTLSGQELPPASTPAAAEVSDAVADATEPDPTGSADLKFTFRHAPWEEVLEWLAGEAGLSFSPDVVPTGTFNYIDEDRTFTTEQAIDLVNSYLLIKGYTLVRKGKMLLVIDLEDEVDAQLVRDLLTETPLSELDRRGDYEITKTRFVLDKVDAAEAEKQINQLLGPVGSIVVMPKAKQIMVTETGGTLRMMREILKTLEQTAAEEESGKLHMYQLSVASADEVLMVARPLLGIPEDGSAAEDGSIRISADPLGRTVFATGTAEKIKLVEQIVKSLDSRSTTDSTTDPAEAPQFMSHPVSSTTPDAVLRVLQTLFVGDPVIRLEIDTATNGILAYAKAAQHRAIKATIEEMEQNPERVEVIPLQNTDPAVATLLIEKLFAGVQKPPVVDGTLDPPQLAVRGTQPQIEQIRELLDSLGEGREAMSTRSIIDRGNMRIVPMDPETARSVAERIQGIWPSLRQNPIRVLVPSRPSALQMDRPDEPSPNGPGRPASGCSPDVGRRAGVGVSDRCVPTVTCVLARRSGRTTRRNDRRLTSPFGPPDRCRRRLSCCRSLSRRQNPPMRRPRRMKVPRKACPRKFSIRPMRRPKMAPTPMPTRVKRRTLSRRSLPAASQPRNRRRPRSSSQPRPRD